MYFFAIGASFCQNVLSLQLCYQLDILQRQIFKTEAIVVYTNREDKKLNSYIIMEIIEILAIVAMILTAGIVARMSSKRSFKKLSSDETINRTELLKILKGRMYGSLALFVILLVPVVVLKMQFGISIFAAPATSLAFWFIACIIRWCLYIWHVIISNFVIFKFHL